MIIVTGTKLLASPDAVVYVHALDDGFGGAWLDCQSSYHVGGRTGVMAAGDFDGNGRADVAYDGLDGPVVLLSQQARAERGARARADPGRRSCHAPCSRAPWSPCAG